MFVSWWLRLVVLMSVRCESLDGAGVMVLLVVLRNCIFSVDSTLVFLLPAVELLSLMISCWVLVLRVVVTSALMLVDDDDKTLCLLGLTVFRLMVRVILMTVMLLVRVQSLWVGCLSVLARVTLCMLVSSVDVSVLMKFLLLLVTGSLMMIVLGEVCCILCVTVVVVRVVARDLPNELGV